MNIHYVFATIYALLMCSFIRSCILQYIITEQYFNAIMANMLFYQFLQSIIYIETKKQTFFLLC